MYGSGCWEVFVAVFWLGDGSFVREGENETFPKKIDWSAPPWIFDAWKRAAGDSLYDSSSEGRSLSEREPEEEEGLDSNMEDSNSKVEMDGEVQLELIGEDKEQEGMERDSNSRENEDDEEETTRTPLSMKSSNGATDQGTSIKNIRQSPPTTCTSPKTKRHKSNSTTAKFEGYDVRFDLIPTLQKIWLNHENIMEDCAIHNGKIVSIALESLATMVSILDDILVKDLTDDQADYLSSSLADLRYMRFKVDWLAPLVEKAVEIQKNKDILESYNDYIKSNTEINERRAILIEELAKLREEENKLKEKIAVASKKISVLGQVEFDKPLGSGLT